MHHSHDVLFILIKIFGLANFVWKNKLNKHMNKKMFWCKLKYTK